MNSSNDKTTSFLNYVIQCKIYNNQYCWNYVITKWFLNVNYNSRECWKDKKNKYYIYNYIDYEM